MVHQITVRKSSKRGNQTRVGCTRGPRKSHRLLQDIEFKDLLRTLCSITKDYMDRLRRIAERFMFGDIHEDRVKKKQEQRQNFSYWRESRRLAGKHRKLAQWLRKQFGEIGTPEFAANLLQSQLS